MAITLVQEKFRDFNGTSITVTLDAAPTNGNTLIVAVKSATSVGPISSITQTGATWARAVRSITNVCTEIWYTTSLSGASANVVVHPTSSGFARIDVSEWSGWATAPTVDQTNTSTGTSQNPTSPSITTTKANSLIIAAVGLTTTQSPNTPTNSFTDFPLMTRFDADAAYRIVSSTGTYSTGWTTSGSASWDSVIANFNAGLSNATSLAGAIAPAAAITKKPKIQRAGGLTPLGVLAHIGHLFFAVLQGLITPAGGLATHKTRFITPSGATTIGRSLLGIVTKAPYNWGAFRDSKSIAWPSWYHNNAHRRERRPS